MRVVVIIVVMVVMRGRAGGRGVGAALGLKRRRFGMHVATEPGHHAGDDVIGPDTQRTIEHLHRQMPVAQMPGNAHQRVRRGVDIHDWLGRRRYPHNAMRHYQPVAMPQAARLRQIQQNLAPRLRCQQNAAPVPLVEIEADAVYFPPRGPFASGQNLMHLLGRSYCQNRKYRCAIGSTVAGSQVNRTPSARTS